MDVRDHFQSYCRYSRSRSRKMVCMIVRLLSWFPLEMNSLVSAFNICHFPKLLKELTCIFKRSTYVRPQQKINTLGWAKDLFKRLVKSIHKNYEPLYTKQKYLLSSIP